LLRISLPAMCVPRRRRGGLQSADGNQALNEPIEPMTLGNMRANGVHSLAVSCHLCHHEAIMSASPWPDDVPVPVFGPRMVCTRCGIIGADARPNWREQPARESLSGVQWR